MDCDRSMLCTITHVNLKKKLDGLRREQSVVYTNWKKLKYKQAGNWMRYSVDIYINIHFFN